MKFTVPGKPKAWIRYNQRMHFDPSAKDKKLIAQYAMVAKAESCSKQMKGDLMAIMTFYKADSKKRDLDNLMKNVMDALNGVLYGDDSQIVRALVAKTQCSIDKERTEIEIFPI